MFHKKKVGPRRKWGRVEDVGWGEDISKKKVGSGRNGGGGLEDGFSGRRWG
jgi:hypothetical protein